MIKNAKKTNNELFFKFFKNLLFERVPHMKTICNDDEIYIAFVIYEGVFSLKVILAKFTKARE